MVSRVCIAHPFDFAQGRLSLRDKGGAPAFLSPCYHATVFNFGKPKTVGDWIVHVAGGVVALLLVWWMLRSYVL